jgi:hypothetical protein
MFVYLRHNISQTACQHETILTLPTLVDQHWMLINDRYEYCYNNKLLLQYFDLINYFINTLRVYNVRCQ